MNAREKILGRIKKALEKPAEKPVPKPDFSAPIYAQSPEIHQEVIFAENFRRNKSTFFYCENIEEFLYQISNFLAEKQYKSIFVWEDYLKQLLQVAKISFQRDDENFLDADLGITLCEALVARTGSILVSSKQQAGRRLGIYPHAHIVVAFSSQIVYDLEEAFDDLRKKYKDDLPSMISLISGPSQTADIEKTLVLGAHGPKELTLFLIDG